MARVCNGAVSRRGRNMPGMLKEKKGTMKLIPPVSDMVAMNVYKKIMSYSSQEIELSVGNKLCSKTKEIIRRVGIFVSDLISTAPSLGYADNLTAAIVGCSSSIVSRILCEDSSVPSAFSSASPRKFDVLPSCEPRAYVPLSTEDRRQRLLQKYPAYVYDKIQRMVRCSWKTGPTMTLTYLNERLKEDMQSEVPWTESRSNLCEILKALGFKYGKIYDRAKLYENPSLTQWRHKYLKEMKDLRDENAFITYSDETWFFKGMKTARAWQEPYALENPNEMRRLGFKVGPDPAPGKGERAIVIGTICENGIVPNSFKLITNCGDVSDGDYHRKMTAEVFESYVHKVFPEIVKLAGTRTPCFVIDNARYHLRISDAHKIPTQACKKQVIFDYLQSVNISCSLKMKKPELVNFLNNYLHSIGGREKNTVYMIDIIAAQYGVKIVRLPPYHCCLNPIEYFWGYLKRQLCVQSSPGAKIDALQNTAISIIANMPQSMKENFFNKAAKEEGEFIKKECIQKFINGETQQVMPIVINIEDDDDEDDFDSVFYTSQQEELTVTHVTDMHTTEELRRLLEHIKEIGQKYNITSRRRHS